LNYLISLIRLYAFWLIFFLVERLIFVCRFWESISESGTLEVFHIFQSALRLDASMAGYVLVIPALLWAVEISSGKYFVSSRFLIGYQQFFIVLFAVVGAVNLNIYQEWGAKVNFKVFKIFVNYPYESTISSLETGIGLTIAILLMQVLFFGWLVRFFIRPAYRTHAWLVRPFLSLFILGLTFLSVRGGWQLAPISQSMSYFSSKPILNHAAVNTSWNLAQDVVNNLAGNSGDFHYLPEAQVDSVLQVYQSADSQQRTEILRSKRPNVVFIILESFTADVVESLGGEPGISAELGQLMQQGVSFTNLYASGDRTDKGLIAVLSAFPAQATRSIISETDKQEHLPSIAQVLKEQGYHTSFMYGGESEFFGFKPYVLSHGFDRSTDKHAFTAADQNSKWGAHDGVVFKRFQQELGQMKQPFFATMLTLSNHEPFEIPETPRFPGSDLPNRFRSTAFYTDKSLGSFFRSARQESWFQNTLFVIVADHGHRLPKEKYAISESQRFHIPLVLVGDIIKPEFRGKQFSVFGSQTDIAKTVLGQLGLDGSRFTFSQDLLSTHSDRGYAFFDWDNGFGVISKNGFTSFDNAGKRLIKQEGSPGLLTFGQAYMQKVFATYEAY
jgi:phosphoglycerol transferase MdoB-like AlkP superfamily enzyme